MTNPISYLLNVNLETPDFDFFLKSAFESGLRFLRDAANFSNLSFLFSADPLYQNVRIDRSMLCFW